LTKLENSLGGDLWTQTITLMGGVINNALQETQDQACKITPQSSLARCSLAKLSLTKLSLAELSLAEPSLAELSLIQSMGYD